MDGFFFDEGSEGEKKFGFPTIIPVVLRHYTDVELKGIYDVVKLEENDDFRTRQYEGYVGAGYYPGFARGNGISNQPFINMPMAQCKLILHFLDNVKARAGSSPPPQKVVNEVILGEGGVEYKRNFHEAQVVLMGIPDVTTEVVVLNAGTGAAVDAAKVLGLTVVGYDPDPVLCAKSAHPGGANVKQGKYLDLLPLLVNKTVLLHRVLKVLPNCIHVLIGQGNNVIVIDDDPIYAGYSYLKPTFHAYQYQVATTFKYYSTMGKLMIPYNNRNCQINPEIIVNFDCFCFVGFSALPVYRFLKILDPEGKKKLCYLGAPSPGDKTRFNPDTDGRTLFVADGDFQLLETVMRQQDSLYNMRIEREMSNTYLGKILPALGMVTVDTLRQLGFLGDLSSIPNAEIVKGMVYSTDVYRSLEVDFPYFMRNPRVTNFTRLDGNADSTEHIRIAPYFGGFSIVKATRSGIARVMASCVHPDIDIAYEHVHSYRIVSTVNTEVNTKLNAGSRSLLQEVPFMFSLKSVQIFCKSKMNMSIAEISAFMTSLNSDARVKFSRSKNFVLNPQGCLHLLQDDVAAISTLIVQEKVDFSDMLKILFAVNMPWLQLVGYNIIVEVGKLPGYCYVTPSYVIVSLRSLRDTGHRKSTIAKWSGFIPCVESHNEEDVVIYNRLIDAHMWTVLALVDTN